MKNTFAISVIGLAAFVAAAGENECLSSKLLAAQTAAGFDDASGRNLRKFPPHRLVDAQRMTLDITIPDMNTPRMSAVQTLTVAAIGLRDIPQIQLNAVGLVVSSVKTDGHEVSFAQADGLLKLSFSPAIKAGESLTLTTTYTVANAELGLVWTPESPAWPGRPAQIHTQGQPETNSYWFPCLDFPNERLSTELKVTVPQGFEVLSNGRLISKSAHGATTTFHWMQEKPHVNYLVSMVVGKFDIVDVGTTTLPMPVYAPLGRKYDVAGTYGHTKDMVALFEKLTGHAYPWDKYAQSIVWNFGAGGMENTSCTTMHESAILSREAQLDHDMDGLISHELAHQWFGDLVTCNSWEHIWLNEGFATYFTSLWMEHRDGPDAYLAAVRGNFDGVIGADRTPAPDAPGMASKVYSHPWEPFRRAANPYGKGASVLHMLRSGLGDELFFKGIKLYLDRRELKTSESIDLRTALEDVSGKDLRQFFHQWVERPGIPRLNVNTVWSNGELSVDIEQTQTINGDNPAFEFALPLLIAEPGAAPRIERVAVTGRTRQAKLPCAAQPLYVAVDPALALLAEINTNQAVEAWRAQAEVGATMPARQSALSQLRALKDTKSVPLAAQLAHKATEYIGVRVSAVALIGAAGSVDDLLPFLSPEVDRWEVREAACGAVSAMQQAGSLDAARAASVSSAIERLATKDPSQRVRSTAVRALGVLGSPQADAIIEQSLQSDSQEDDIRQAAVDALCSRGGEKALTAAIKMTGPTYLPRTRAKAAGVVVAMASANHNAAYAALVAMLGSPETRTRIAAGQGLVDLGDARAIAEFDRTLAASPTKDVEWMVGGWKKALEAKLAK